MLLGISAAYLVARFFLLRSDVGTMMTRETGYLFGMITPLSSKERHA